MYTPSSRKQHMWLTGKAPWFGGFICVCIDKLHKILQPCSALSVVHSRSQFCFSPNIVCLRSPGSFSSGPFWHLWSLHVVFFKYLRADRFFPPHAVDLIRCGFGRSRTFDSDTRPGFFLHLQHERFFFFFFFSCQSTAVPGGKQNRPVFFFFLIVHIFLGWWFVGWTIAWFQIWIYQYSSDIYAMSTEYIYIYIYGLYIDICMYSVLSNIYRYTVEVWSIESIGLRAEKNIINMTKGLNGSQRNARSTTWTVFSRASTAYWAAGHWWMGGSDPNKLRVELPLVVLSSCFKSCLSVSSS